MQRSLIETVMGAIVLIAAAVFLYVIYTGSGLREEADGYSLIIRFDSGGSTLPGTDVRISGVKVGAVTDQRFDPETYQAVVTLTIDDQVKLPKDSSAVVTSDGLLGNSYIKLLPGAEEEILKNGDSILHAQGALDLAELITKFVAGGDSKSQ